MQRILIQKCFLFRVGSVCRLKYFTTGSRNSLRDVRKSQMMPDQVPKWLRQQSKDFYAAGFDSLQSDGTSVSVLVEDMSRNKYFPRFEYHMFYVLYPFVTYLLTLPRIYFGGPITRDLSMSFLCLTHSFFYTASFCRNKIVIA
jgi:hypothetical protein